MLNLSIRARMRVLEGGFADVAVAAVAAATGGERAGMDGEAVGCSLWIGFLRERREGGKGHNINFRGTAWMRAILGV